MREAVVLAGICFGLAVAPSSAWAQEPPVPPAPPPAVTPPELRQFAEADYPAEALAAGLEASVELAITIDSAGVVTDAEVVAPVGNGFDEAAVDAARRFVFEPARRNGVGVPSRIRYRYVFELREAPVPPPEATSAEPRPGRFSGRVVDPNGDRSIADEEDAFSAIARVDPPPREVTRRTIEREELTRIPGTRGDALRTVEILPGVGRPPFGAGALLVRGSSPGDSQVNLNGVGVPILYHFGGLTSFINSRFLEQIDFFPGNFSARFGRKIGGILDVETRDPARDRFRAVADVNLIDSSFLVEGPVTEELSIAAGARRSYVDSFFEYVVPSSLFDVVAAPVYYDYQLFSTYRPTSRDRVRLLVFGSSDEFRIVFANPADHDPAVRGNLDLQTHFHRAQLAWRRRFSSDLTQDVTLSVGSTGLEFGLGPDLKFQLSVLGVEGRSEWEYRIDRSLRLIAGLDVLAGPYQFDFRGPQPGQREGNPEGEPLSGREILALHEEGTAYRPAAYVEADTRITEHLQIVLGLRADWYREIESWSFDPRMVVSYQLDEATRLKAGAGYFSQPPEFNESERTIGNPDLAVIRARHWGAGIERELAEGIQIGVEGFLKLLVDRVVATQGGAPPLYTNDGVGRIYGLEVSGKIEPRGRYFGYLSYTLSRSERRDRPTDIWRLFDFDQTHILTVSGVYRLGSGWEAGATFRLVSGNPTTPVAGSIYRADTDLYQPIFGAMNTKRNPFFHRLDVRVEKKWRMAGWDLALYLDVQNAYNSTNREGVFYNYDYTRSGDVPGLPIIPSLGVRGEL